MRLFIPEIHDIHPGSLDAITSLLSILPVNVRDALMLLIVPCWRDEEPIEVGSAVLSLVHSLPGEKALHGYSHYRPDSLWNRLWFGTDHHGEFYRLSVQEARERLALGLTAFEKAGLPRPRHFCAPRWRQSKATSEALFSLGFQGFMDQRGYRTRHGVRYCIPVVSFDSGHRTLHTILHTFATRLHLSRLLATGKPFRLAMHPSDMYDRRVSPLLISLLKRLENENWQPTTIGEIIHL